MAPTRTAFFVEFGISATWPSSAPAYAVRRGAPEATAHATRDLPSYAHGLADNNLSGSILMPRRSLGGCSTPCNAGLYGPALVVPPSSFRPRELAPTLPSSSVLSAVPSNLAVDAVMSRDAGQASQR